MLTMTEQTENPGKSNPGTHYSILKQGSWSHDRDSGDEEEENTLLNAGSPQSDGSNAPEGSYKEQLQTRPNENESVDIMRRRLKFFFMNPIEKWQARRKIPYKFIIQIIKIVLITAQLSLFAHNNYIHVNYTWDNRIAFSHLFLQGWDASQEVPAYPPATGPLALYKKDDFYDTVDYAVEGYYNLSNAIGSYSYPFENDTGIIELCLYNYKEGTIFGFNESYIFNSEIDENCIKISEIDGKAYDSKKLLRENRIEVNFSSLVKAELKFSLKTVNLKAAGPITPPDCYQFDILILFDNQDFDGQMLLSLDANPKRLICRGDTQYITDNQIESLLHTMLNSFVIVICSISLVLCSRALYRGQLLRIETANFFNRTYGKPLSLEGHLGFLDTWYVMIIVNDVLIIIGSALKEQIEMKMYGSDYWNFCSLCLGTGNLLVWFGILRYLGFFKTYNVIVLTLKKAFPDVIRFCLVAIIIYSGFTFCGWLVLGPYHMKFRSLATTSECLFALINGDELFATFSMISFKSPLLWWFSRFYLYSFISLFIYVVLSLFISVIMDAFDTIKSYYLNGFPKNDLQTFISVCTDKPSSGAFRNLENESFNGIPESCWNFKW